MKTFREWITTEKEAELFMEATLYATMLPAGSLKEKTLVLIALEAKPVWEAYKRRNTPGANGQTPCDCGSLNHSECSATYQAPSEEEAMDMLLRRK